MQHLFEDINNLCWLKQSITGAVLQQVDDIRKQLELEIQQERYVALSDASGKQYTTEQEVRELLSDIDLAGFNDDINIAGQDLDDIYLMYRDAQLDALVALEDIILENQLFRDSLNQGGL